MTKLIVGLGNPGERFVGTRHNVGREALLAWVKTRGNFSGWANEERWPAEVGRVDVAGQRIWLLFPLTFMNESGVAVAKFSQKQGIEPEEVVVVHDDLELALGEVKWKEGGSAAGHNGVKSVQAQVGSQVMRRLRLGVGRPQEHIPAEQFVLRRFLPEELAVVEEMKARAGEELERLVDKVY